MPIFNSTGGLPTETGGEEIICLLLLLLPTEIRVSFGEQKWGQNESSRKEEVCTVDWIGWIGALLIVCALRMSAS